MRRLISHLLVVVALAALAGAQPVAYVFSTFAGQNTPPGTADGPGNLARFSGPTGVAVDAFGNIFVADTRNHTIRKITPGGIVSTFAGKAGEAGAQDGIDGRLNAPGHLAFDREGNLLV